MKRLAECPQQILNKFSTVTISWYIWQGISDWFKILRSSPPEVFLGKGVLKICSKFTGAHPCRSAISITLLWNFIEIAPRHACSPANSLHIFRTLFYKNIYEDLLLNSPNLIFLPFCGSNVNKTNFIFTSHYT